MNIEYTEGFKRQLKRLSRKYKRIKTDVSPILQALANGETPGSQITGVPYTMYKVRAQNSDSKRGKSGGYRIIYYLKTDTRCILVTIYSKAEQSDITADALKQILKEFE